MIGGGRGELCGLRAAGCGCGLRANPGVSRGADLRLPLGAPVVAHGLRLARASPMISLRSLSAHGIVQCRAESNLIFVILAFIYLYKDSEILGNKVREEQPKIVAYH